MLSSPDGMTTASNLPRSLQKKRRAYLVLLTVALVGSALAVAGDPEVVPLAPTSTGFTLEENEAGDELIVVSLAEIKIGAIDIDGGRWAVIEAPGCANHMSRGLPSLPFVDTEYLLGRRDGIKLELVETIEHEIDLGARGFFGVAPSKGHFSRK